MRKRLLDFLRCPDCKQSLELIAFDVSDDEIDTGVLYCAKRHFFPIVGGPTDSEPNGYRRLPHVMDEIAHKKRPSIAEDPKNASKNGSMLLKDW